MSQPPFQPPPQPPQPPQQPQQPQQPPPAYNPYAQPGPPQPPGFGAPPVPGQPPMQAGQPSPPGPAPMYAAPSYQVPPFGQQPVRSGNPVGAVLLGFLVSFVVALLFSVLIVVIAKDLTFATSTTLYLAHALLNGAIVGALIGSVGHRSNGARIGGAIIAALGAFFGWANFLPIFIVKEDGGMALKSLLESEPFFPAKAWWIDEASGGVDWTSPLGLVIAAAAAWGIAYLVGNKRRHV
ncbi:hypothetical protein ACWCPI_36745 [Streptomyces sp. NPDC001920]